MAIRDKTGKFTSQKKLEEEQDRKTVITLVLFAAFAITILLLWATIPPWLGDIRNTSYQKGYQTAKDDTFSDAFKKGQEFERNWTQCPEWNWWRMYYSTEPEYRLCAKDNSYHIRYVDKYYNVKEDYEMPDWARDLWVMEPV